MPVFPAPDFPETLQCKCDWNWIKISGKNLWYRVTQKDVCPWKFQLWLWLKSYLFQITTTYYSVYGRPFTRVSTISVDFLSIYGFPKMCSKCPPFRCKQTCTRLAKLLITFTHSSFGMALIFAVMAVFSSSIVCGFPWYTLSFRKPHR